MEHDPERFKRKERDTGQLLRRLKGLIHNFMVDHKQYHVAFLYGGKNMMN